MIGIAIGLGLLVAVILTSAGFLYLQREYRKHLEWIRDRVDLKTQRGRDVAVYVNRELDRINGKKRKSGEREMRKV